MADSNESAKTSRSGSPDGGETLVFKPLSGEKPAPCVVCHEPVHWDNLAVQCDSVSVEGDASVDAHQNHWTHVRCLEKTHLLDGSMVPLTDELMHKLDGMEFSFLCPLCSEGDSLPLPLQLFNQGKLSVEDIKTLGAFTSKVEDYFKKIRTQSVKSKVSMHGSENTVPSTLADITAPAGFDFSPLIPPVVSGTTVDTATPPGFNFNPIIPPVVSSTASFGTPTGVLDSTLNPNIPVCTGVLGSTFSPNIPVCGMGGPSFCTATIPTVVNPTSFISSPAGMSQNSNIWGNPVRSLVSTSVPNPFLQPPQNPVQSVGDPTITVLQGMMNMMMQHQQTQQHQQMQLQEQMNRQMESFLSILERKETQSNANLRAERELWSRTVENQHAQSSHPSTEFGTGQPSSVSGFAKLPKVEMPTFDGKILEWPQFWDMFHEMVDKHKRFSDIEKLHYLLTHLTGDAKKAVQNYKLQAENYQHVVKTLKKRFDDKQKIRDAHLQALVSLCSVSKVDVNQLQNFRDTVDSHARALITLMNDDEALVDLQCSTLVPSLFEKLPILLRSQMYEQDGKEVKSCLSKFRHSLEKRIEIQADIQGQTWLSTLGTGSSSGSKGPIQPKVSGVGKLRATMAGASLVASNGKRSERNETFLENPGNTGQKTKESKGARKREPNCRFCEVKGKHRSFECPVYKTVAERKAKIGSACYICLKPNHFSRDCPTAGKFSCYSCKSEKHNSALCPELGKQFAGKSSSSKQETISQRLENPTAGEPTHLSADAAVKQAYQRAEAEFAVQYEGDEEVAMQTAITMVRNPTTFDKMKVSVFMDSGSKRTYISERVANAIQLPARRKHTLQVCTFNSEKKSINVGITDFQILGKNNKYIGLTGSIVDKIAQTFLLSEIPLSEEDQQLVDKLPIADPYWNQTRNFQVDILIGNDFYPLLLGDKKFKLEKSGAHLIETKLGWVPAGIMNGTLGPNNSFETLAVLVNDHKPIVLEEDTLTSKVEDLWQFESIGIRDPKGADPEDDLALKQFWDTVKFENGRVCVKWIKSEDCENLPTNFPVALRRLGSLLRALGKNEEYREKYARNFSDQLEKGVIEKVTPEMNQGYPTHYIPHHAVLTPLKTTTKMRIVFDASAKMNKNSRSLNECLLRGPNLLPDLCSLIMRVRLKDIAVIADIEKAFLQVSLQEPDRDLTRFLWLKDPTKLTLEDNLQIYRFCRVPFGFKPSPFLLAGAICYLLDRASKPEKNIANQVWKDLYVDNLITGTETVEMALKVYKIAKQLLAAGRMNLREWTSNSDEFLSKIPQADKAHERSVKLLGFTWNTESDKFSLCMKLWDSFSEAITKRQILACVASIFDPLGLIGCLKIQGLIFIQKLWKIKVGWDESPPEEVLQNWQNLIQPLKLIPEITFPRCCFTANKNSTLDLICFCDASKEAYTTLIYLRLENENRTGNISLLFTKARLSPISGLSIPRAELMAVLIGTRCLKFVANSLDLPIRHWYLWTDSQCVLGWIRNKSRDQGVFVTNRVLEIVQCDKTTFAYIPTDQNPADLSSKSRNPDFQIPWEFWWEGPTWLKDPVETWPKFEVEPVMICTLASVGGGSKVKQSKIEKELALEEVFEVKKYPTLMTLVRVTAWVLRFVRNLKQKVEQKKSELRPSSHPMTTRSKGKWEIKTLREVPALDRVELKKGESLWFRNVQQKAFPDLFSEKITQSNFAQNLKLKLGEDGILRSEGRFGLAEMTMNMRCPVILPSKSDFTDLVVKTIHEGYLHAGVNYTLAKLRSRFWIPKGRVVVQKYRNKCEGCKRYRAKPFAHPPMPDLPKERVTMAPPFTFTGVDYFGPMYCRDYKEPKKEKKAWTVLFTCLTIRAVHLELVSDMSAQSFIGALRRFVARRGKPKTIISDNALQFKVTKKVLEEAESTKLDRAVETHCNKVGIEWKFIPELSPWMGGVYERMVGITKNALKKALGKTSLTSEQLHTVLVEIESIVNSRPLTYVPMGEDDEDFEILTPQNFLTASRPENLPVLADDDPSDPEFIPKSTNRTKLIQVWKQSQYYLNLFWISWRDNYLLNLRERHSSDKFPKVKSQTFRPPKVGEIVLVKNEHAPRGIWKIGKILNVHKGKDGEIRSAEVKTSGTRDSITRPISHLFPLEINSEDKDTSAEISELNFLNFDSCLEKMAKAMVDPKDFIEELSDQEGDEKGPKVRDTRERPCHITNYQSPLEKSGYKIPKQNEKQDLRSVIEKSRKDKQAEKEYIENEVEKEMASKRGEIRKKAAEMAKSRGNAVEQNKNAIAIPEGKRLCSKCKKFVPIERRFCYCEMKAFKKAKKQEQWLQRQLAQSQGGSRSHHQPSKGLNHKFSRGFYHQNQQSRGGQNLGQRQQNPGPSTSRFQPSSSYRDNKVQKSQRGERFGPKEEKSSEGVQEPQGGSGLKCVKSYPNGTVEFILK